MNQFQKITKILLMLCAPGLLAPSAYALSDSQTLPLTFNIEPVTVVRAQSSSGGPSIDLGAVVPGVELPAQILQVSVLTNTEEAYHVYHEIRNEMTSGAGAQVPDQSFQFSVTAGTGNGESAVGSQIPVPVQRTTIFNSSGGPATFMIHYTLSSQHLFEAGDYDGTVHISLENN